MEKNKKELPINELPIFNSMLKHKEESLNSVSGYKERELEQSRKIMK